MVRPRKSDLTLAQAKKLSEQIVSGLIVTAQKIEQFIAGRGWIALGYSDFMDWWQSEVGSQTTLGPEIRAHVVFQMLLDGKDDITIASAIKHVGVDSVKNLRRERNNGLKAEDATGRSIVQSNTGYLKRKNSDPYMFRVEVTEEQRASCLAIAGSPTEMHRMARDFILKGFGVS